MKVIALPVFLAGILLLTACAGGSLSGGAGGSVPSGPVLYQAVEMTASWPAGATGSPTSFKAITPATFPGLLCPASSITLSYGQSNATSGFDPTGLLVGSSCTIGISLAVCSFNGTPSGGTQGLSPCAVDPLQTNFSTFRFLSYSGPTPLGPTAIELLPNPSIIIFYCSNQSRFTAPPLSSSVGCLG